MKKVLTNPEVGGIIKVQRKTKEIIKMTCYTINIEWYNEIKDLIKCENVYIYYDEKSFYNCQFVELDVNEEEFIYHSKQLGWM